MTEAVNKGLLQLTPSDEAFDGRTVELDGRKLVNFGSCSYLGLELDPRMREAVIDAVTRYGTQFSSSRGYLSSPQYVELEALLDELFGGHALVVPTTSLGHLATLPVLVESTDAVLLDHQVHASVQMAANQLRVKGATVELIRHNNMERLEAMIERLAPKHSRIWYMADGVYSMFADLAPFAQLRELLDRHPQLELYIDDSHGVGWAGQHGRGPALDVLAGHPRVIAACSLNKSFAAAGGAIVFPNEELRRRVRTAGGPMLFSGPVQPPLLGAAIQSAKIHLSDELPVLQAALRERIDLFTDLADEFCIPLASRDVTPIRYVPLGLPVVTHDVIHNLFADGQYVNLGTFPAVPMKHAGVRATLTLHHTLDDVRALVERLAVHVPAALERGGEAARRRHEKVAGTAPALTLEHVRSAEALKAEEWDALLGERGTFTVDGLKFLEQAFAGGERPEDEWAFHYYVVRNRAGKPVLATFFTAALWKDDMLAAAEVSELVEARRAEDPYYLTSMTFGMGSLLTEGDHLYLDRNADWKGALDLLLPAVSEHAAAAGAGTIVLRDLYSADLELAEAIRERGYVKTSLPASLVYEPVVGGDEEWLGAADVQGAGAPAQGRAAVRRRVRRRVPRVRRAPGLRGRARPSLRALSGRAGARPRSQLVPAPEGLPARDARASVVGADDAAAALDRARRRVRRALPRRAALRADDRRARLRGRALARRLPAGAAAGDPAGALAGLQARAAGHGRDVREDPLRRAHAGARGLRAGGGPLLLRGPGGAGRRHALGVISCLV